MCASSPDSDVYHYVIIRNLLDTIFVIFSVFICGQEIGTYLQRTFLQRGCPHKTWRSLHRWVDAPKLYIFISATDIRFWVSLSNNKFRGFQSGSELYRPSDRPLSTKLVPTFADRGCRVVSAMDPYGRILGFLDRIRYYSFQVAPQLYSRGWVDPVPGPLILRKSSSAGNRTRTSGVSVSHVSIFVAVVLK
jgi:hypothetical protein